MGIQRTQKQENKKDKEYKDSLVSVGVMTLWLLWRLRASQSVRTTAGYRTAVSSL